jgi:sirohydrochlorin ferrochelatase
MQIGVLLIGHGSRVIEANRPLRMLAGQLREQGRSIVAVAFLEHDKPDIQGGIDCCVEQGAERILLYPYFLSAGAHVLKDIPAQIQTAAQRYPELELSLGRPLGLSPKLVEIVGAEVAESIDASGWNG